MAIETSIGGKLRKLNVDGPVASNNLLMQLQADLSGLSVCEFYSNTLYSWYNLAALKKKTNKI